MTGDCCVSMIHTVLFFSLVSSTLITWMITLFTKASPLHTTAYHKSVVQTAYFCSPCKYCIRGETRKSVAEIGVFKEGGSVRVISLSLIQQLEKRSLIYWLFNRVFNHLSRSLLEHRRKPGLTNVYKYFSWIRRPLLITGNIKVITDRFWKLTLRTAWLK